MTAPHPMTAPLPVPAPTIAPPDPDDPHLPVGPASRAWRRLDRLTIAAFVLLLPIPALLMLAGARPRAIENRPLYSAPPVTLGALGDPAWFATLDRAIGDNVKFRPAAVKIRAKVVMTLGGSPNPAVVRGTGDWLFALEELAPVCAATADETVVRLDAARAAFDAAGQTFRFVLAPDKHAVYPERRRPDDGLGEGCSADRRPVVSAALDARPWAVNGWSILDAARAADPGGPDLYYHQDSHWTTAGAMPTIRALVRSLDPALWSDDDIRADGERRSAMDLARQVGLPRHEAAPQVVVRPGVTVVRSEVPVPVKIANARAILRFTAHGDRPTLPGRTAIVYDSFFGGHRRELAPFFAESVWIHLGDLQAHPELAAAVGPFDRVILERVERGLYTYDLQAQLAPLVRATPAP